MCGATISLHGNTKNTNVFDVRKLKKKNVIDMLHILVYNIYLIKQK